MMAARSTVRLFAHRGIVALSTACAIVFLGGSFAVAGDFSSHEATKFLKAHCVSCHGEDVEEGGVNLAGPIKISAESKAVGLWSRVVEVLKFKQMPPPDEEPPSDADADRFANWTQAQLLAQGVELDVDHKLLQPAYANLLNHERLFDGSAKSAAYSRPRMWRWHPEAYELFLEAFGRQLSEGGPLSKPFTIGEGKGDPSNYAALVQADSATLGQLMLNCRQIAKWQTVGFTKLKKDNRTKMMVERTFRNTPPTFQALIDAESVTEELIGAAVAEEFRLVLSRHPTEEEAAAFAQLLSDSIDVGGRERGLQTLAMAILLRPEAIYRMEIGLGPAERDGRRRLSPYELAYAISFALTDKPPGQLLVGEPKPNDRNRRPQKPTLMDLAEQGQLSTREDVRRVIEKLWDADYVEKPRILRFFQEFFGYAAAESVFKGDRAGRNFVSRFLVKDADQLVLHIVEQDRDVLKRLLTTKRFFVQWPGSTKEYDRRIEYITKRIKKDRPGDVNFKYFIARVEKQQLRPMPQANPTWRQIVRFYNLDEQTWDYPLEQPFELPEGQRVGLLTHPAWLVAWSGNFGNDPIRRGKWIRDHLLAGSVPDVPITVNAQVPEDPHKTLRQRLEVTRQEYCWKCHRKMEPLGLPFEAFTDFGRFRVEEGLGATKALSKPMAKAPVETLGRIESSGDESLDGAVKDVHELMQRLSASPRVRQSFVRHAFRYWLGRNETMVDSPTLIAADQDYVEQQGSFRALVISLLTSDSFIYRK